MTIRHERAFDEWLADIDTMAGLGYRPLLSVLRNGADFELHSPALGPELATVVSRLARDLEAGPPAVVAGVPSEPRGERDDSVIAFVELLEARKAEGSLPYYMLFTDDAGALHSLSELGIEDLPGFLRWLSFEVAEGGSDEETD